MASTCRRSIGRGDVRLDCYHRLKEIVQGAQGIRLTDAIEQAVELCRSNPPERLAAAPDRLQKTPWRFLKLFLEELMRRQPVALDESGELFGPVWAEGEREVYAFVEGFDVIFDGEFFVALW